MSEFRRRLMAQVASDPNALPAGCVRLEYIEGTGTQWIDTEKIVYNTEEMLLDMQYLGCDYNNAVFGWRWKGDPSQPYQCYSNENPTGNAKYTLYIGITESNNTGIAIPNPNARKKILVSPQSGYISIDGVIINSGYNLKNIFDGDKGSVYSNTLLTLNILGTPNQILISKARIFEYSLTDPQGNYTQHLIPILDPQGVPCMYDTVAKKFHYNKGTGDFEFDKSSIVLPDGCIELEYLKSNGKSWISTEYIPQKGDALTFKNVSSNTTALSHIFSAHDGDYQLAIASQVETIKVAYYKYFATGAAKSFPFNVGDIYDIEIHSDGTLYANGVLQTQSFPTGNINTNLFLFKAANNSSYHIGTLGEVIIVRNGVEIERLIPVLNPEGIACYYDAIRKKYLYNQGTEDFAFVYKNNTDIPSNCTRLEYIEGTGTQYIDTGKVVYADEDINIDFEFTTGSGTYVIAGWRWQGTVSDPYGFLINKLPNVEMQIYYGFSPANNTGIVLDNNSRNNVVISPNNKKIVVNDTVVSGNYDTTFTNAYNGDKGSECHCAIFTVNIAGTFLANTVTPMKLYGYSITNSKGEYVQNLVPILDSNGIPCLYDTVKKRFHYNQGTGQFKFNQNSTDIPVDCVRCEWLESDTTNGQYIDTEMLVESTDTIKYVFAAMDENVTKACFGWRWTGNYATGDQCYIELNTSTFKSALGESNQVQGNIPFIIGEKIIATFNALTGAVSFTGGANLSYISSTPQKAFNNGDSVYSPLLFTFTNIGKPGSGSNSRVYEYILTNKDGVKRQHLIPICDSQDIPCMYDIINKKYHYNKQGNNFAYKLTE